ncbi:MAG: polysaccharide biosynthesis C-terminal domain-containing protein, partial [Candidatus Methanomethylophilaceae archaeon]|nr:polysaccharide biosynthesis C-terminal domain-containing protein [Candidatus Methanomethylophilaceae archaeon]
SVIVTLVAVFGVMPLMYAVGGPLIAISGGGYNIELSMEYMMPYIFCTLPIMMNGLFIGLIRSEGAARKSMAISVSASVLNMVLDPILIYVLDMGIVGASWATCISFIIPTIAAILLYVRKMMYVEISLAAFRFDKTLLKEIAVIAVPYTAETLLVSLMTVPEQGVVASCGGPEGLVIYTNAFYYVMLVTIPTQAFCAALLPVVSTQIGQKAPGKIRESISFSLKIVVGIGLVMSVFLFLAADILADIYTYAEEMKPLHDEMAMAIRIYSAVPAILGVMRVWTAVLQALRRAFLSSFLMFFREVVFLCAYIVASTISMTAIYWSVDLTNVIMCVIMAMIGMTVLKDSLGKMTKDPGL